MKDIREIIFDQSPKNVKKLQEAIGNGGCGQYFNAFAAELAQPTAAVFPNFKFVITDNFFCDYTNVLAFSNKRLIVFPIAEVTNVYRSNIVPEGYDFDYFYLAMEHTNEPTSYHCRTVKNNKNSMKPIDDIVQFIRARLAVRNINAEVR